ncbi:MAG: DUF4105 domain-containing protein [Gemmatimonadaceae bacterium]
MTRFCAALSLCIAAALPAQPTRPVPANAPAATAASTPTTSARYRVSVLTFGQGDLVFERFGHNALRVVDVLTGADLAYNWGMFSFAQPNFLGRFLSGDTRYWVEAFPSQWLIDEYARQDRETFEQDLNLTPEEAEQLAAAVATNALEANKFYRYDYFRDNCSTKLRDALDSALGGALKTQFSVGTTLWTYRSESVRLTAADGLAQAGIDIALGPRADIPITAWEAMFIPMRLRDYLPDVTVPAPGGGTRPLVAAERKLHSARRAPELIERKGLSFGPWGPIIGAWVVLLIPLSAASRARTRIPAALMAGLWYTVTGILGVALLGMWLGSAHVFWYKNVNLFLLSPLALIAAWPAARAILRGTASPLARGLVAALTAMSVLALLLGLFGVQTMGGPLLLFLPANIGLAIAFWRHTRPAA